MRATLILLGLLCALPATTLAQDEAAASPQPAESPAVGPPLDLVLHRDPTEGRQDQAWGAVRVVAKLESTMLYLDGEFIGSGTALRDRVIPGVHLLEGKLASGRKMAASILVRPGAIVDYSVHIGAKEGEKAYAVLMNIAAIVGTTLVGSAAASSGSQAIQSDVPGLITGQDTMKSGNKQLPRP